MVRERKVVPSIRARLNNIGLISVGPDVLVPESSPISLELRPKSAFASLQPGYLIHTLSDHREQEP